MRYAAVNCGRMHREEVSIEQDAGKEACLYSGSTRLASQWLFHNAHCRSWSDAFVCAYWLLV